MVLWPADVLGATVQLVNALSFRLPGGDERPMRIRSRRVLIPALRGCGLPIDLVRVLWGSGFIDPYDRSASADDRFFAVVGSESTDRLRDGVGWLWWCAGVLAVGELSRHAPPQGGGCVIGREGSVGCHPFQQFRDGCAAGVEGGDVVSEGDCERVVVDPRVDRRVVCQPIPG